MFSMLKLDVPKGGMGRAGGPPSTGGEGRTSGQGWGVRIAQKQKRGKERRENKEGKMRTSEEGHPKSVENKPSS